jgi:hypothetical protein
LSDRSILSEAIVLKNRRGLTDETEVFRKRPLPYIPLTTSTAHALSLSTGRIRPRDSFWIVITGARNMTAKIAYIVDKGPTQVFEVALDHQGQSRLDVSESTRKGFYRFVGFAIGGEYSWIRSDATITVE